MTNKLLDFDDVPTNKNNMTKTDQANTKKIAEISTKTFIDKYLRLYSGHSNVRGIPFIGDGLKEAQRKALWGMLNRGENAPLISVERVSASVSADTDYHHGIVSMQGTIVKLAQNFAGSNNVNFLVPEGQFGSRRSQDASAPRYIETTLHDNFRKIFLKADDILLEQKVVGDVKIEPKYFIPLLPVVLLNGAEGMGTGHATVIFAYNPTDIIASIIKVLNGQTLTPGALLPWWKDFTGTVIRHPNGQVVITGTFKVVSTTEIRVTELPVGIESDTYEKHLFKLEDKGLIKSFKNASDDNGFEFILKVPRTTSSLDPSELTKLLKMEAKDTENLTVWDADGCLHKYDSVEDILVDFVKWRLERYEERRVRQIEITQQQLNWLNEVIRFIEFYLEHSQQFRNTGKKDLLELLTVNNFTQPDKLLGLPIWTLTKDHIAELWVKASNEEKKLVALNDDTPVKMYKRELKELRL